MLLFVLLLFEICVRASQRQSWKLAKTYRRRLRNGLNIDLRCSTLCIYLFLFNPKNSKIGVGTDRKRWSWSALLAIMKFCQSCFFNIYYIRVFSLDSCPTNKSWAQQMAFTLNYIKITFSHLIDFDILNNLGVEENIIYIKSKPTTCGILVPYHAIMVHLLHGIRNRKDYIQITNTNKFQQFTF